MKTIMLALLPLLFLSGCATVESRHQDWATLVVQYHKDCDAWAKMAKTKLTHRYVGEERARASEIANRRCLENSKVCTPPRKIEGIEYYELYFNERETRDYCQDFDSSGELAKVFIRNRDRVLLSSRH